MKRIFFLLVLLGSLAKSYAGPIITFYEDFSLKIEGKKVYLVKNTIVMAIKLRLLLMKNTYCLLIVKRLILL